MFNWFKRNNNSVLQGGEGETEFSLIWYKRMYAGKRTHYTQPFRTRVKAKSYEEAKEKLASMVLSKMQLVITPEHDFDKTELFMVQSEFNKVNDAMREMEKCMEKVFQ